MEGLGGLLRVSDSSNPIPVYIPFFETFTRRRQPLYLYLDAWTGTICGANMQDYVLKVIDYILDYYREKGVNATFNYTVSSGTVKVYIYGDGELLDTIELTLWPLDVTCIGYVLVEASEEAYRVLKLSHEMLRVCYNELESLRLDEAS